MHSELPSFRPRTARPLRAEGVEVPVPEGLHQLSRQSLNGRHATRKPAGRVVKLLDSDDEVAQFRNCERTSLEPELEAELLVLLGRGIGLAGGGTLRAGNG